MTQNHTALAELGWTPFFQSQLSLDEIESLVPARVMGDFGELLEVAGANFTGRIRPLLGDATARATVGDWLLMNAETQAPVRLLQRQSLFQRKAAGLEVKAQLIAANIDTVFVMSSCNRDFNLARIERYLALAHEAEVTPIIVLSKADLAEAADDFRIQAQSISPTILVEVVDTRDPASVAGLLPWCGIGQTVAVLGSSGVGKSTLVNTLTGSSQLTQGVRQDDSKGRHTTTGRSMHRLPVGGWLLDTPGMRELQLMDVAAGIEALFSDITALAVECRFSDCAHKSEPDCAVRSAILAGDLDEARLERYRKLLNEDSRNAESIAEARKRARAFGKIGKAAVKNKRQGG